MRIRTLLSAFAPLLIIPAALALAEDDPYLWLENIDGEKALEWVETRNAADTAELENVPVFDAIHEKLLEIYNSKDNIPEPQIRGDWVYNFWQDAEHVRGIWRRTHFDDYLAEDPNWETVLDLDALAETEGENWVWKDGSSLPPEHRRWMLSLSRGGGDAVVQREFDAESGQFVEGGFTVPEAKSDVSWKDENTLWVGSDFGEGTLTSSGYPRIAKEWKRGTPLEDATTVFEGNLDDVAVTAYSEHTPERRYDLVVQTPEFFRGFYQLITDDGLVPIEIPEDAELYGFFKERMLVHLRTDWRSDGKLYPGDALLAIDFDRFLEGDRSFEILFDPAERISFRSLRTTKSQLVYSTLENVKGKLHRLSLDAGGWSREEIPLPGLGTVYLGSASDDADRFFFTYMDFVTPSGLYLVRGVDAPEPIKSSPAWFDTEGVTVTQNEATSKDGTRIPYFLVTPRGFQANGFAPTILYGYGGFEVSKLPTYSGTIGSAWIERGGVYALANIRGGGEFGPQWHEAAMKEKHQNNFDDFAAVAEDLIERKVTSPAHLGIMGGSQGGLLVGGTFVQRPELFEAVVCQVPLLDMKRYNKLLAGASWMAEYGNPDTEDWDDYMKFWSPYQNLEAEKDYPRVFFTTTTRDDRVHPGHARKMVAKMTDMGMPVYYYENTEGGHSSGANLNQQAYTWALTFSYLWKMLGDDGQS